MTIFLIGILNAGCVSLRAQESDDKFALAANASWAVGEAGADVVRNGFYRLAFSPDGRYLAGRTQHNEVRVFDCESQEQVCAIIEEGDRINHLAFHPSGEFFLTAIPGDGVPLRIYETESGRIVKELGSNLRLAYFSEDGTQIVAAGPQRIETFSWPDGKASKGPLWRLNATHVVNAMTEDGSIIFSSSPGRRRPSANVFRTNSSGAVTLRGIDGPVRWARISPDGGWVAATFNYGENVFLWDLSVPRSGRFTLAGHSEPVQSFEFSPCGRFLLTTSLDQSAILWDVQAKKKIKVFTNAHRDRVHSSAFHPFNLQFATGSSGNNDNRIIVWDYQDVLFDRSEIPESFREFDVAWKEMGDEDPSRSLKAAQAFLEFGEKWIPIVRTKLISPVNGNTEEAILKLIEQLDAPQFKVREEATKQLVIIRSRAEKLLEQALEENLVKAEGRHRIQKILKQPIVPPKMAADERRRIQRCLLALELMESIAAAELLNDLASHEDYYIASASLNAVERREKRTKSFVR